MAESEQSRQIVVATDNVRLVLGEFKRGIVRDRIDSPQLGLSLVTFTDTEAAGNELAARRKQEAAFGDVQEPQADTVRDPLNRVLVELRLRYRTLYAGWSPLMGKNRTLSPVQFKPYTHEYDRPEPIGPLDPLPFDDDVTANRVRVGLFDTRLASHSQLNGRCVADAGTMIRPVPTGQERQWWEGHATFVAGLIRRHAPSAILDVRTTLREAPAAGENASAEESWNLSMWDFAARLDEFRKAEISVLNLSLGVVTDDSEPPTLLARAIAQLTPTIIVVAAAGNHGSSEISQEERERLHMPLQRNAVMFPAALDNVIAVGAYEEVVDKAGHTQRTIADFTPRGATDNEFAPWIDVYAKGVDVESTYLGEQGGERMYLRDKDGRTTEETFNGYARGGGTSFATGLITAEVARLLAAGCPPAETVAKVRENFARP